MMDLRRALGTDLLVPTLKEEGPRILDRLLREPGGGGGT
jgi:hypothetical protein